MRKTTSCLELIWTYEERNGFDASLTGSEPITSRRRHIINRQSPQCSLQRSYLHGHWEVVLGFRRKENVHGFLWEWLVSSGRGSHFNDVQLEAIRQSSVTQISAEVNSIRPRPTRHDWFPTRRFCCKSYFSSRLSADSEAEQSWLFRVSLHLELCEPGGVSLNGLGHLPVHRVELHGSDDAVLLRSREQVRFGRDRGEFQVKHERAAKRF